MKTLTLNRTRNTPVASSARFLDLQIAGSPGYCPPSTPVISRLLRGKDGQDQSEAIERAIRLGWNGHNFDEATRELVAEIQRGIYSGMSNFPVRENLEAEAKILTPIRTPLRNMLPRTTGAGLKAEWILATSFGTAFGTVTTTSGTSNPANTLVVANAAGFYAGETILVNDATAYTIASVDYADNEIAVTGTIGLDTQTNGQSVIKTSLFQPGGVTAEQFFFAEDGAPAEVETEYDREEAPYKLGGEIREVTIPAIAMGRNFQDQLATEKRNGLMSVMLQEENALLHARDDLVDAPWGDGTTAYAYRGLLQFIEEEAPASHVQTTIGALTHDFLVRNLMRIHYQGGEELYILASGQEVISMNKIAFATGNQRYILGPENTTLGTRVSGIVHPITGQPVPIIWSPFMPQGTMVFGAKYLPDMSPAAEVDVLPQTNDFGMADGEPIQGYVAQEIAPDRASPMVLPFLISIISVPKWKAGQVFVMATGITPAS